MVEVMEYYGLVIFLAREIYQRLPVSAANSIELEDLIQEGFLGLLQAGDKFEPDRGIQFGTFARPRIEGAIRDNLRRQDPLSQEVRGRIRSLEKARDECQQSLGREPSTREIAEALGIREEEVLELESLRTLGEHYEPRTEEGVEAERIEERVPVSPTQEIDWVGRDFDDCLEETLNETEQRVLTFRLRQGLTLGEVGKILGIASIETVRRRENSAKKNMKHCLEGKGWELVDILTLFNQ